MSVFKVNIVEAAPFIQKYRDKLIVIKASGGLFEKGQERAAKNTLEQMILLKAVGAHPVMIHGGGNQITQALKEEGFPERRDAAGNRISSSDEMMIIDTMLGKLNQSICKSFNHCAQALSLDISALGAEAVYDEPVVFSAALAERTGTVKQVDACRLVDMARSAMVPIFHSLGRGEDGELHNINADDVACAVAIGTEAERLIFLSKVNGVLDDKGVTIPELNEESAADYIARGIIRGGMKKKVAEMLDVAQHIGGVVTLHGEETNGIFNELMRVKGAGSGTLVTRAPVR